MWVGMSRREREAGQMWVTVILSLVCLAVQTVPDWGPQVTIQRIFLVPGQVGFSTLRGNTIWAKICRSAGVCVSVSCV